MAKEYTGTPFDPNNYESLLKDGTEEHGPHKLKITIDTRDQIFPAASGIEIPNKKELVGTANKNRPDVEDFRDLY